MTIRRLAAFRPVPARPAPVLPTLGRRAALLFAASALSGCSMFDDWFGETKTPLPGTRIAVASEHRALAVDRGLGRKVVLPPPTTNADWPQSGGGPAHLGGHPAAGAKLAVAWRADIGEGSGYRRAVTARPVIAGGRVFTMDADGAVSSFDAAAGTRQWRTETAPEDSRSTNLGGGLAVAGATLYAATGRAELLAIEAASGKIQWRKPLPAPARSAPTVADNRIFVGTIDSEMVAMAQADGQRLWAYQSEGAATEVVGLPAPAYADGIVIAGFESGDLVALRAVSGAVAWADSLAAARGRTALADLSAVRGMPVIADGRVYAVSLGRLLLADDLYSGRRLWDRDVASADSPWLAGGFLFVLDTDSQIAALDASDGAVIWVTQLDRYEDMKKQRDPITWCGPVLAGDRLIVCGTHGVALAVSPYTGEVLGKQTLSAGVTLAPVVAGNTVYVVTSDGALTALR
jgi:outer membrane protein assembly factor BamB